MQLEIWGTAPAYQLNILEVKINNLLRSIYGIYRQNGIPIMGTQEMFRTFNLLRLGSLFKLRLYKFLRALLDGRLPELYDILLRPYLVHHRYVTRGGRFRHPNLSCEIERRFLSYQLIVLYEQLPNEVFENTVPMSLSVLKQFLITTQ